MKRKVAVIYGGDSSETDISVMSGKYVAANIDRERYDVYEVFIKGYEWSLCDGNCESVVKTATVDKTDFSVTIGNRRHKFDIAYIMIHGTPGENGLLQGYLEMMGIPFTTCSSYVSALTFNKYSCKRFLKDTGILMADDVYLRSSESFSVDEIIERLGLPLFVKPTGGGSSFGVTKVRERGELPKAIESAFLESSSVLIEEAIEGRELTEGAFSSKGKLVMLPVTEIVSHNDYFDYDAKYLGKSDEICPAPIKDETAGRVSEVTATIYRHFGCKGLIRADYILKGDEIYFLELNTVPGMTRMSLVPKQVETAGIDMKDFFNTLLDELAG